MELEFMKQLKIYKMQENQTDLFEQYETLPESVRAIIDAINEYYYSIMEAKRRMNDIGYTFDYGIDFQPYNLKKI